MEDPTYGHISNIIPGCTPSGDDYDSLASWFTAVKGETEIQHARCYEGDGTGCGDAVFSPIGCNFVGSLSSSTPCCIYAADGEEQDGTLDDTQGACIKMTNPASAAFGAALPHMKLSGMRCYNMTTAGLIIAFVANSATVSCSIEKCSFVNIYESTSPALILLQPATTSATISLENCIGQRGSTGISTGYASITGIATGGSATLSYAFENCSLDAYGSSSVAGLYFNPGGNVTLNAAINRTVIYSSTGSSLATGGAGTVNLSGDYNASHDDLLPGANTQDNQSRSDFWNTFDGTGVPLVPKIKGVLDDGPSHTSIGPNGSTSSLETDGIGRLRQTLGGHDYIGALIIPRHPTLLENEIQGSFE
jgi:hypothetical protein